MLLYPDSSDMILLDPNDPAHLARAREVIRGLAAPWHADETAAPRPGEECWTCPVRRSRARPRCPWRAAARHRTEMRRSANDQADNDRHGRP